MRCSRRGKVGATARPNWTERAEAAGDAAIMTVRLSAAQRRALELLARAPHGVESVELRPDSRFDRAGGERFVRPRGPRAEYPFKSRK